MTSRSIGAHVYKHVVGGGAGEPHTGRVWLPCEQPTQALKTKAAQYRLTSNMDGNSLRLPFKSGYLINNYILSSTANSENEFNITYM